MAAGMGSRFGGLKQIEPIGPNGEVILDFSVYDAVKAGFNKVVFIIRRDIEEDFRKITKQRIEKMVDCEFVFQDMDELPENFKAPTDRAKPWGTGHAIYCTRNVVKTPFAIINADDYYGQESFKIINDYLENDDGMCMVGFKLGNTLTENGTVARGVCEEKDGVLNGICEHTSIDKNSGIPLDTTVSMNMWGLQPDMFDYLEKDFIDFLKKMQNPLKDEFFIPFVIDNMIKTENARVKVLKTNEKWYGVTYKEDKALVVDAMKEKIAKGCYINL
ncbi:MAG: nucleotidyltransferase [Clostridia bacterium]|nr:nucleotidyltransferase [Clostridia bacterium]